VFAPKLLAHQQREKWKAKKIGISGGEVQDNCADESLNGGNLRDIDERSSNEATQRTKTHQDHKQHRPSSE